MKDLPTGWARVQLSEICHIEMGQSPPSSTYNNRGQGLPFLQGKGEFGDLYPTPIKFCSQPKKIAKTGSVLLSVRAPVGPTNITRNKCCIGRGLAAISPLGGIANHFVLMQLRNLEPVLAKSGAGSTFSAISKAQISSLMIVLPPLTEQRRIIAKIDALFEEIDRGVESLQNVKKAIDLYRQSLLKSAFEGRLTAKWREENAHKLESPEVLLDRIRKERERAYENAIENWRQSLSKLSKNGNIKKSAKPKNLKQYSHENLAIDLHELPFGWTWTHLGSCSLGSDYGTSAKSNGRGGTPVLRMGNIQNGRIDWNDLVYSTDKDEIETYSLKRGDVLFNRTNSPEHVGKSAIYRGERPALFAGYLVRVNQIDSIASGTYVTYFLNSPRAREHGNRVKTDGVNQSNINGTKLQSYPIPICSSSEQAEIVRTLDTNLHATEELNREIDSAIVCADVLRQSILEKAFSGQLVKQKPEDEPASVLLDRIEAIKLKLCHKDRRTTDGN